MREELPKSQEQKFKQSLENAKQNAPEWVEILKLLNDKIDVAKLGPFKHQDRTEKQKKYVIELFGERDKNSASLFQKISELILDAAVVVIKSDLKISKVKALGDTEIGAANLKCILENNFFIPDNLYEKIHDLNRWVNYAFDKDGKQLKSYGESYKGLQKLTEIVDNRYRSFTDRKDLLSSLIAIFSIKDNKHSSCEVLNEFRQLQSGKIKCNEITEKQQELYYKKFDNQVTNWDRELHRKISSANKNLSKNLLALSKSVNKLAKTVNNRDAVEKVDLPRKQQLVAHLRIIINQQIASPQSDDKFGRKLEFFLEEVDTFKRFNYLKGLQMIGKIIQWPAINLKIFSDENENHHQAPYSYALKSASQLIDDAEKKGKATDQVMAIKAYGCIIKQMMAPEAADNFLSRNIKPLLKKIEKNNENKFSLEELSDLFKSYERQRQRKLQLLEKRIIPAFKQLKLNNGWLFKVRKNISEKKPIDLEVYKTELNNFDDVLNLADQLLNEKNSFEDKKAIDLKTMLKLADQLVENAERRKVRFPEERVLAAEIRLTINLQIIESRVSNNLNIKTFSKKLEPLLKKAQRNFKTHRNPIGLRIISKMLRCLMIIPAIVDGIRSLVARKGVGLFSNKTRSKQTAERLDSLVNQQQAIKH